MLKKGSDVRLVAVAAISMILGTANAFDLYRDNPMDALKTDPKHAAQQSMERGDYSLIMVPQCFMGMPGYEGGQPPTTPPKILGKSCEELLGLEGSADINALKTWAREYNAYVQQHNKQPKPTP